MQDSDNIQIEVTTISKGLIKLNASTTGRSGRPASLELAIQDVLPSPQLEPLHPRTVRGF